MYMQSDEKLRVVAFDAHGLAHDVIAHDVPHRGEHGPYIADPGLINAANTALGLQLPLLLTGEPGCGKSDFAWLAAHALGLAEPLCCYIRSDTRARDLLYHYDALRRFGDAQHGAPGMASDPRNYIRLRPLGIALMTQGIRPVVLIDEIDKAPRDLPNDLLHELDAGSFEIAELDGSLDNRSHPDHLKIPLRHEMKRPIGRKPFIVITSNAERQLPEPFLRRCVFYHIPPPSPVRLLEIARVRFGDNSRLFEALTLRLEDLVDIFAALRVHAASQRLTKSPTTAEMIEWLRACTELYRPQDIAAPLQGIREAIDSTTGKLSKGKVSRGRSYRGSPA
ncbi:AAA family ATPase [Nannocystis pusilla]|uniref:AAA family ATPase n=1 Tax=Nannocystis pusilla TaxID=889268 RepID=UPI003B81F4A4